MTLTQLINALVWSTVLTMCVNGSLAGFGPRPRMVHAQDSEPAFDVLVRIDHPADRPLLNRVRGQTSDLNVLLLADTAQPIEPTLLAQLETARRLAQEQDTRVVVWFTHDAEVITVFVAEPSEGRVLVRRIAPSEGRLGGSAQQESAALVVRSALRALAAGGEIGVTEQEAAPPPAKAPIAIPRFTPPPPPPRTAPASSLEILQFLGARSALGAASDIGQHSVFARLGVRRARYQAELRLAFGIPVSSDDEVARLSLSRHGAGVHAAYLPLRNRRFVGSVALGAGANLFLTDVTGRNADFKAKDSALAVAVLSADATLRFMPDWGRQRVGVAGLLGADLLPQAVVVGYSAPDKQFVARDKTWHVLPSISLELVVRLN